MEEREEGILSLLVSSFPTPLALPSVTLLAFYECRLRAISLFLQI